MKRVTEPELMIDEEQVIAYARADFSDINTKFVEQIIDQFPPSQDMERLADLGCGPGDITQDLANAFPQTQVVGIDGSSAMIEFAKKQAQQKQSKNLEYRCELIPGLSFPDHSVDLIVSNSLLHHIHEPDLFWSECKRIAKPGAGLFLCDLFRPKTEAEARQIVDTADVSADQILLTDFYNSLLAAFTPAEVRDQLQRRDLDLKVEVISERHMIVFGRL